MKYRRFKMLVQLREEGASDPICEVLFELDGNRFSYEVVKAYAATPEFWARQFLKLSDVDNYYGFLFWPHGEERVKDKWTTWEEVGYWLMSPEGEYESVEARFKLLEAEEVR